MSKEKSLETKQDKPNYLTVVGTDKAKQYSAGKLIGLNYERQDDDSHKFSYEITSSEQSLRFVWFPEVTGCHMVIGVDKVSKTLWFAHVSIAQRDNRSVHRSYNQPPPCYSQLLSENYSETGVGIPIGKEIDFIIIDKSYSFREDTFRAALEGGVGKIMRIVPSIEYGLTETEIVYDIDHEKIYYFPRHYFEASIQQIQRNVGDKEAKQVKSSEEIAKELGRTAIEGVKAEVKTVAREPDQIQSYLRHMLFGKELGPDFFELIPLAHQVQKELNLSGSMFEAFKSVLSRCYLGEGEQDKPFSLHRTGVTFLCLRYKKGLLSDAEAQAAGMKLLTYAAEKLASKQAALLLAELYANRAEIGFELDRGDPEKALYFLKRAKDNGSQSAVQFLADNESGESPWFIEKTPSQLPTAGVSETSSSQAAILANSMASGGIISQGFAISTAVKLSQSGDVGDGVIEFEQADGVLKVASSSGGGY